MKEAAAVRRFILHALSGILLFALFGCARYEYEVVRPPDLAGHIGSKAWVALRRGDVEYRAISSDNRLVMRLYNRGEVQVKLLGADSAVVDPRGESRPLLGATIPPGSYVTRIFPPPRPTVQRTGPGIGFGVGAGYAGAQRVRGSRYRYHRHPHHFHSGFSSFERRYDTVYDPNDRTHFDWPGETSVRFLFTLEREVGELIRHEFLIRRTKM
jgi:hypothetical protein